MTLVSGVVLDLKLAKSQRERREEAQARVRKTLDSTKRDGSQVLLMLLCAASRHRRKSTMVDPFPPGFVTGKEKDFQTLEEVLASVDLSLDVKDMPDRVLYVLDWLFHRLGLALGKEVDRPVDDHHRSKLKPTWRFRVDTTEDPSFEALAQEYGTVVGYHGSSLGQFHSILHHGLQNLSGTEHMQSGEILGSGIYLAEEVSVAQNFMRFGPISLLKSAGLSAPMMSFGAIAECELICHPDNMKSTSGGPSAYYVVQEEHHVRLKSIYIYSTPSSSSFWFWFGFLLCTTTGGLILLWMTIRRTVRRSRMMTYHGYIRIIIIRVNDSETTFRIIDAFQACILCGHF